MNGSLSSAASAAKERHESAAASGLQLDMSRGKPSPDQLSLVEGMLESVSPGDVRSEHGTDCRNYGGDLFGLPEARRLFAAMLDVSADSVIVQDNSSLRLMFDTVAQCLLVGTSQAGPWRALDKVKFLCPVPGYDRHFGLLEYFGVEMIPVDMTDVGPEMETVERLVRDDASVRGIFCVPRHSNPTGATYSAVTVQALASMSTAAPDFRIFWDNAYAVHHLTSSPPPLSSLLDSCEQAGNPDRVLMFGSTSKISFAGSGVSLLAASASNLSWLRGHLSKQSIGPDKLNQLRHVRFFRDLAGIESHMRRHAEIIGPKFELVDRVLEERLGGLVSSDGRPLASWSLPHGGYFISFDVLPECARRVYDLASQAGLKLTPAGATFPLGDDPRDQNLRLAPTMPSLDELERATELIADCVVLASAELQSGA